MSATDPLARSIDTNHAHGGLAMHRFLLVAAAGISLAACGSTDEPAEPAAPADATLESTATGDLAGTYEIKLADGTVTIQTINPDGTYVEATPEGTRTGGGTWRAGDDGTMCFDPEGDEPEECYAGGAPEEDGAFEMRGEDGKARSSVRKVETQPAPAAEPTPEE